MQENRTRMIRLKSKNRNLKIETEIAEIYSDIVLIMSGPFFCIVSD